MNTKKLLPILICFCLLANTITAIGVSPPRIIIEHFTRGASYEQTIHLSGIEPGNKVTITGEGAIANWATIDQGNDFIYPDVDTLPLTITIDAPPHAKNGHYEGKLKVVAKTEESKQKAAQEVSFIAGVTITLETTITGEQVMDYRLQGLSLGKTEEGKPLPIHLKVENKGNVLAGPTSVSIQVYDQHRQGFINEILIDDVEETPPFTTETITLNAMHDLAEGQYWASITVHGATEDWTEEIIFEVAPKGSLQTTLSLLEILVQDGLETGMPQKVQAYIFNDGELPAKTTFHAEIYHEGRLMEVQKSDELLIEPGETTTIPIYFTPQEEGMYEIIGHLSYLQKRTPEKKTTLTIGKPQTDKVSTNAIKKMTQKGIYVGSTRINLVNTALLAILITLFAIKLRRKWRRGR